MVIQILKYNLDIDEVNRLIIKWSVYTYSKLLSEQIFEPLSEIDDKSIMYAPFQMMAQYYIFWGYKIFKKYPKLPKNSLHLIKKVVKYVVICG